MQATHHIQRVFQLPYIVYRLILGLNCNSYINTVESLFRGY